MNKFYDIKDFKCINCNCDEYDVISFEPLVIVCSKCGQEIDIKFYNKLKIINVE